MKDTLTLHLGEAAGDKKAEVPEDCDTLFVLGPSVPLSRTSLDAMERYLDRGGRMFVGIGLFGTSDFSKLKETGIEEFLKKYGVNVTDQFLFRVPDQRDQSFVGGLWRNPAFVFAEAPASAENDLAKQFAASPGNSTKYKVEPLLVVKSVLVNQSRPVVLPESSLRLFTTSFERYLSEKASEQPLEKLLPREPLPVAVTVSKEDKETSKPRMVVVGSGDFLANPFFSSPLFDSNYDLAVSALEWMGERGFVGPRPKETNSFSFGLEPDFRKMQLGVFWTLTILLVILGACTFIVRRR